MRKLDYLDQINWSEHQSINQSIIFLDVLYQTNREMWNCSLSEVFCVQQKFLGPCITAKGHPKSGVTSTQRLRLSYEY